MGKTTVTALENLYLDYVNSEDYKGIEHHPRIKEVGRELSEELKKHNLTEEAKGAIEDYAMQHMVAGEEQGFINGFKYATRLLTEAMQK